MDLLISLCSVSLEEKYIYILYILRVVYIYIHFSILFLVVQLVRNPPTMWETWVGFLGWDDPLEKGTATHSSILSWGIPRTVQSMGSQRVGHD